MYALSTTAGPPFQLHFSPNSLTHPPLTTQLSTATPTPDESARLLAGQTPNYPPMEKHPLNHDPIPPYATMDQIRSSGGYSPPETNHLTIDCRGGGYPSPVGNSPPPQQVMARAYEEKRACNSLSTLCNHKLRIRRRIL